MNLNRNADIGILSEKKRRDFLGIPPYILPQYHASLTQPIKYTESYIFAIFVCRANDIVYARFEDFRTFLYTFKSVVIVSMR